MTSALGTGIEDVWLSSASSAPGGLASRIASRVERERQTSLERRDLRLGVVDIGLGLRHVEGRREAGSEPIAGQLQALLLELEIAPRHRDAVLQGAQINVAEGYLRRQRHQDVSEVLDRRVVVGECGLDPTADAAEHVRFPGRRDAD